jgi:hypothetical protein
VLIFLEISFLELALLELPLIEASSWSPKRVMVCKHTLKRWSRTTNSPPRRWSRNCKLTSEEVVTKLQTHLRGGGHETANSPPRRWSRNCKLASEEVVTKLQTHLRWGGHETANSSKEGHVMQFAKMYSKTIESIKSNLFLNGLFSTNKLLVTHN